MNRLRHGAAPKGQADKTRWTKFKDTVKKCPETIAYASIVLPATVQFARHLPDTAAQTAPWFGTFALSMFASMAAFVRERVWDYDSKVRKTVSRAIAGASYALGMAMMFKIDPGAGLQLGALGTVAAVLYEPFRKFVLDKSMSVSEKIKTVAVFVPVVGGAALTGLGLGPGGVSHFISEKFGMAFNGWQAAGVEAVAWVTAMACIAFPFVLADQNRKMENDKRQKGKPNT